MTEINYITIKNPLYKIKTVNNTTVDRIIRYKDCNKEYIANFSIRDITLEDGEITSITLSKGGETTTFDLSEPDIINYIYENTNPQYIELVPKDTTGKALLSANCALYTFIILLLLEIETEETPAEPVTDPEEPVDPNNNNTNDTEPITEPTEPTTNQADPEEQTEP